MKYFKIGLEDFIKLVVSDYSDTKFFYNDVSKYYSILVHINAIYFKVKDSYIVFTDAEYDKLIDLIPMLKEKLKEVDYMTEENIDVLVEQSYFNKRIKELENNPKVTLIQMTDSIYKIGIKVSNLTKYISYSISSCGRLVLIQKTDLYFLNRYLPGIVNNIIGVRILNNNSCQESMEQKEEELNTNTDKCAVEDRGTHYRFSYKGVHLDPARIAMIYGITNPMQFQALKKILCAGKRGHKDTIEDIKDIACAVNRWQELLQEE